MEYHEQQEFSSPGPGRPSPPQRRVSGRPRAGSGPLGTTYEIRRPPQTAGTINLTRRLEKWALQSVARVLLPSERVRICLRHIRETEVSVWKHKESAHYSGLMVCGSVWHCPVCAAKISERRRADLLQGIESWRGKGGQVLLLTLTIPHYAGEALKPLLAKFQHARRLMWDRSSWKTWTRSVGLVGTVRALEVTHGGNGWHVHTHELLFLDGGAAADASEILPLWKAACRSVGLPEPNEHGVDLQNGDYAAQYAGKWGLEHELTKAQIKKGKAGGRTPWDFLRDVLETGDADSGDLFQDYAKAFKGKRQLVWSKGLRKNLGLDVELTDEEIASAVEEEASLLGTLTPEQWRLILRSDKRGQVLLVASLEGWPAVLRMLTTLKEEEDEKKLHKMRRAHDKYNGRRKELLQSSDSSICAGSDGNACS